MDDVLPPGSRITVSTTCTGSSTPVAGLQTTPPAYILASQ
jgi:hypothetical protein